LEHNTTPRRSTLKKPCHLEATQKHAAAGVKSSGHSLQNSINQVLADARASVQQISEAIAARRSAKSTPTRK